MKRTQGTGNSQSIARLIARELRSGNRMKAEWHPARHTGMDGVTGNDTSGHGTALCDNDRCSHPKHYTKRC